MSTDLRDAFVRSARRFAGRPAVRYLDQERTYGELLERATRLANALNAAGVRQGDRVGLLVEDRIEPIEVHVACAVGGFVTVVLNHRLSAPELIRMVEDCDARALIHTDGLTELIGKMDVASELLLVTIGEDVAESALDYEQLLAGGSARLPEVSIDADHVALLGYTSGTTGDPKGVMMTHGRIALGARTQSQTYRFVNYGVTALTGNLSFAATGPGIVYPTLLTGGSVRLFRAADVDEWFAFFARDRATLTYAPSPLFTDMADRFEANPELLGHLQTVLHGASVPHRAAAERLCGLVGHAYTEVYGMTESSGLAVAATGSTDRLPDCAADDPLETVGRATALNRISVVVDGQVLEQGDARTGELVVEGDALFSGYWKNEKATNEVLDGSVYKTGDLGRIDAAGYVYLSGGRVSELINTGGMKVYPVEVERELESHPLVVEAAVFGRPHPRWGHAVTAAVRLVGGAEVGADELAEHCRSRIAAFKKPTEIHFVEEFPRTVSMKVKKADLKRQLGLG